MPIIDRDFPDAVRMPDGSLRIVTWAARTWLYRNTKVKRFCNCADDVPRFVLAAADVLGVSEVVFLGLPDQGLEETPDFRKQIVRLIRQYRPGIVVTADPYRRYVWHRDHRIAGQVVLDAVFPYARDHLAYPDLLEQGLQPHKVREMLFWASEDINFRSDITATFDLKVAALRCHDSQMQSLKEPNPETWLRQRCKDIAKDDDFELGEAFHRVEILW